MDGCWGGGSEPPVTSLPNPQQLPKRRWETGLEKVMMTRSSASTSMDLWKMRAWRLRQHAVTLPLRIMADIIQWNTRGIRSNVEELQLLCKQYKPQIVAVQEYASYVNIKLLVS